MSVNGQDRAELEVLFDRLFPMMRSITGEGVRRTHDILSEFLPLERMEIPSGTAVHDWVVPNEWTVREAYVEAPNGARILDVAMHTLHLLNYSAPFRGEVSRAELDSHLYSLPDEPDAIPYVTSYYQERWGFCLPHKQRIALPEGTYKVVIDTTLAPGSMTLSQAILPGSSTQEVLLSTYTCHPSMANNELSGPLALAFLYQRLERLTDRRLTYRFVFVPETIGAITYLSLFGEHLRQNLQAGYVVTCCADHNPITFKQSRRGDSTADHAAQAAIAALGLDDARIRAFFPFGSDERQYCSPGYNLPVGVIARGWPGTAEYPEYHTSLDDKSAISFDNLLQSIDLLEKTCLTLERNRIWINQAPFGEPNLGRRGLMSTVGAKRDRSSLQAAIKWLLNLADGSNDLLAIAQRSGMSIDELDEAATLCAQAGLLSAKGG